MATDEPTPATLPLNTLVRLLSIKLISSNYLIWQSQFVPVLKSYDLFTHVDGSSPSPPPTITSDGKTIVNPAYVSWYALDQKILSLIQASLSEDAMAEVLGLSTARSVWLTLERTCSHSSVCRVNHLRAELFNLQRGSSSVEDYNHKFWLLCEQLASIGRPVDPDDKAHWYLNGLGSQFLAFSDT